MEMFVTMITPYNKDGGIDYETVDKYVDWYYKSGIQGIFSVCQSSEIFNLTLEERVALNKRVYERAKALEKSGTRPFSVMSSGHISNTIEEQAKELNEIYRSGTDALTLITNRLDPNNEGDDVFIENAEKLLALLPPEAKLGLYECPFPYQRLMTPKLFDWCIKTGRFYYMKDTCCDANEIARRVKQLEGSSLKLLNANCQTLLESMRSGAHGYCGIMCNFHPKLYAWLAENFEKDPENADMVQSFIGTFGFIERGLAYPLSAKYNMTLCGMETENLGRTKMSGEFTDYGRDCIRQMKHATDLIEKFLKI